MRLNPPNSQRRFLTPDIRLPGRVSDCHRQLPASRSYYDRKRAEGKTHIQAMLSRVRRRLNVPWAILRDGTTYTRLSAAEPPPAA